MSEGEGFSVQDAPDDADPAAAVVSPDEKKKVRKPRAPDIIGRILNRGVYRRDKLGGVWATVESCGHLETMAVKSPDYRSYCVIAYNAETGKGMSGTQLSDMQLQAEARGHVSGEIIAPCRRSGTDGENIYITHGGGDPSGERRVAVIRPAVNSIPQWEIVGPDSIPVSFVHNRDALALPIPKRMPDVTAETIAEFVNIETSDDLTLVWAFIVCSIRPFLKGGAYPIGFLHAEQGSGKSTASRAIQSLIDPSALFGRSLPREDRDLLITAMRRQLLVFDNVSSIPDAIADCMCRIATGGGYALRTSHTDTDETTFDVTRPMLLNSIPATLSNRPDLADRAISIELATIKRRRSDAEMMALFEHVHPGLIAVMYDGLSAALANLPGTTLEDPPRMMDACLWAMAAAPGLKLPASQIAIAWRNNRDQAERASLASDDLANALVALMEAENGVWKGSPVELLTRLVAIMPERVTRSTYWPRGAQGLGSRIRRIAPALRRVHRIEAQAGKGGADGARFWSVRRQ